MTISHIDNLQNIYPRDYKLLTWQMDGEEGVFTSSLSHSKSVWVHFCFPFPPSSVQMLGNRQAMLL